MGFFKSIFGKKSRPADSDRVLQMLIAYMRRTTDLDGESIAKGAKIVGVLITYIQAESWSESQRIVEQHPEILTEGLDDFLNMVADAQPTEESRQVIIDHRNLLHHCRKVGIEQAFAKRIGVKNYYTDIPAKFRADVQRAKNGLSIYLYAGDSSVLDQAVSAWERILDHTAFPKANKRFRLAVWNDAGAVYLSHYEQTGDIEDLDTAITLFTRVIKHTSVNASDWFRGQTNLGVALFRRFEALGHIVDLDAAIDNYGAALAAVEEGSSEWASIQVNMGNAYARRFESLGILTNLDAAIRFYRAALQVTQERFPHWSKRQNNLGNALTKRFQSLKQVADLDEAISTYEAALSVTNRASPLWSTIQVNLGIALRMRFQALERMRDLDKAIEAFQSVLSVTRKNSCTWNRCKGNLAGALGIRFKALEQVEDLDQAINALRAAISGVLKGSPDWARWQNDLGLILKRLGRKDKAIEAHRKALEVFTPEVYPDYTLRVALLLGRLLMGRGRDEDLDDAAHVYRAARSAADYLYFESLHQGRRKRELSRIQELAAQQAYALAHAGNYREAIEALEAGRARALAESLLGQRALESVTDPTQRESLEAAWRNVREAQSVYQHADDEEVRRRAERQLAQARRAYYDRMRQTFPDYFEPPIFEHVQAAAADAPLVYLAATSAGGLALLVTPNQDSSEPSVHPIWLNELNDEALREQLVGITEEEWREMSARWEKEEPTEQYIQKMSQGYLSTYSFWRRNPRNEDARAAWLEAIDETTRWLWDVAMGPIVEEVAVGDASHTTLIPAGLLGLLPLHAAWTEDPDQPTGRRYALDEINFAYTPNARALDVARERAAGRDAEGLLAVDEPQPVSAGPLPSSSWEATAACDHFPDDERTRLVGGEVATKETVLEALPNYAVLHLSCHGFANPDDPLQSGLLMAHDELLTLRDIYALQLDQARLAVLSACETRIPGIDLPDEVIALPTGLVQAGVPGVVGSLWSVGDLSTAMLMVRFYNLWRGEGLDPAEALRQAQIWLRDTTNAEKAEYFGTELPELNGTRMPEPLADALFKQVALRKPDERAFAHPFHWAAFAFTGV